MRNLLARLAPRAGCAAPPFSPSANASPVLACFGARPAVAHSAAPGSVFPTPFAAAACASPHITADIAPSRSTRTRVAKIATNVLARQPRVCTPSILFRYAQYAGSPSREHARRRPLYAQFGLRYPNFRNLGVDTHWHIGYTVGGSGTKWENIPTPRRLAKQCEWRHLQRLLAQGPLAIQPHLHNGSRESASHAIPNPRLTFYSAAQTQNSQLKASASPAVRTTERAVAPSAPLSLLLAIFRRLLQAAAKLSGI